jgi:drug/metabolite transporter (DMT)-like permease
MAVIWGTNYAIVKAAFREIDPQAFNALRMSIAASLFLMLMVALRAARTADNRPAPQADADSVASIFHTREPIRGAEWLGLVGLGVVGHGIYQYCFIGGLARTSVANSALMLAATPVVIATLTAVLGHDRVGRRHWAGAALSVFGIYLVVGGGFSADADGLTGDLLMFAAVLCWAVYTIGARQLMRRHSPVGVTGLSMAIGAMLYVPLVRAHLAAVEWDRVSGRTWLALVYSSVFALGVAYTIWYAAVRQIGSARTSVYSNVVPIFAMITAVLFLGEPLGARKICGAAAVLLGVAMTRLDREKGRTGDNKEKGEESRGEGPDETTR